MGLTNFTNVFEEHFLCLYWQFVLLTHYVHMDGVQLFSDVGVQLDLVLVFLLCLLQQELGRKQDLPAAYQF